VTSPGDWALLGGAGVLAGAVGSAGGITSLISYPALLAVGVRPLPANVTNAVALVGSFTGSALGSRPELAGQLPWLRRWAALIALGSGTGVALLLLTPDRVFTRVVPYLLVAAVVALVLQPRLSRRRSGPAAGTPLVLGTGIFAMAVYSGYFGAGSGVMVLALLLVLHDDRVPLANALKNMLLGFADLVAALAFAFFGPVHWTAALPLFVGLVAGSTLGPSLTRRVPGTAVRLFAGAAGLGLAVWFWVTPH
jgi:uncharacterized membrane protein YfcA